MTTVRSSWLICMLRSSRENAGTLLMPLPMRFRPSEAYSTTVGLVNEKKSCLQLSLHVGKQSCHIFSRIRRCRTASGTEWSS
jgi:hypothetical protein